MKFTIRSLLSQASLLISIPEIIIKLNSLLRNPRSTVSDFANVIQIDLVLSAKVLKLVNSPYYGLPQPIDSIHQAISVIGMRELSELVFSGSISKSFKKLDFINPPIKLVWRHAIFTGVIARQLAKYCGLSPVEKFFTAGLLHDIGSLILYQFAPTESAQVIAQSEQTNRSTYFHEDRLFGFTSANLGGDLAHLWSLPTTLEESIRFHPNPEHAKLHPVDAALTHISAKLANLFDPYSARPGARGVITPAHWQTLGINSNVLINDKQLIQRQYEEMTAFIFPANLAA